MARHGDTRSPSPAGSLHSHHSSKRNRRVDDRHEKSHREDGRSHYRRRSRSRSPEVGPKPTLRINNDNADQQNQSRRHRDRDRDRDRERDRDRDRDREYRRRDRSIDRRYDDRRDSDYYYSSRRDRSRDRRRSRDRDERRRSRDRGDRSKREDSRDRDRKKRDGSTDSKKRKRDDSPETTSRRESRPVSREVSHLQPIHCHETYTYDQASKPSTPTTQNADDQKAAKLARLEEWKRKRAEEQAKKKQEAEASSPALSILQEMDKKAALSPTTASPQSPATPEVIEPTPYAGKFDPKAIAKKAHTSSSTVKVLGGDIAAPALNTATSKLTASAKPLRPSSPLSSKPKTSLKPTGNLSGFGLGSKVTTEHDTTKKAIDFEEDDDGKRKKKLQALPSLPVDNNDAATDDLNGVDEQDDGDDDVDMQDDATEEALAAARAAAEQRSRAGRGEDVIMDDISSAQQAQTEDADEDEEDPLDAFMSDLAAKPAKKTNFRAATTSNSESKQQEPEALFSDDEIDIVAVDEDNPDNILSMASATVKKKKKDIPTINHAKYQYEPFRRNFYSEPIDLADMTEEEVANLRMELDNITVRGVDVPKPVQTWAQCGLGVQVLEVIQNLGYEAPTSIQSQAVPAIMSGRDIIGVAKTGSGKTIAFLLPMFRHIKDQRPLSSLDGPIGLILSPTRELATQIHKECKPFLKALNLRAVCAYGGAPIKDQIADFKRGAEIVVCTPGRMIDLLAANGGRVTNLQRVTYVVLDEADRMFDMGFEPQVMKILANIRPDRQTVLFSATFPNNMEALARKTLIKPLQVLVGSRSVVAPEITQIVEVRPENTKFHRLLDLLGKLYEDEQNEDDRALIFVDRQESADGLLSDLMKKGYPCMSIHGGKDQIDRDSTINDFKAGIVPILIATSVAARGLDVKQLKLVVNFDAPNHLEDYVHRAGRTGRAGNKGTAVTFLTEEQDRYAVDLAKALKQSGQPVPEPVQNLANSFMEKVKAGKEKARGGFGGKGLERLDQERDAAKARERKTYKTGDEPEEQEEQEEVRDVKVGDDIFAKAASGVRASDAPPTPTPQLIGVPKGIDLDGKITVHRTERPEAGAQPQGRMDKVSAAVAAINQKLSKAGVMRSGVPIDNKGPDAGAFHATLEINDFPRKYFSIVIVLFAMLSRLQCSW